MVFRHATTIAAEEVNLNLAMSIAPTYSPRHAPKSVFI